ncbi:hypothetical protein ACHWQZ_G018442 [Mnemiopsis leidyi]
MEDPVAQTVEEVVPEVVKNVTGRAAASTEGLTLAYISLFLMAVVPIFWGSFRSISYHRKSKENGEAVETMSTKDVYMFPILASSMLFGIYLVVKYLSADHLNLVVASYFFIVGSLALTAILRPVVGIIPGASLLVETELYHLKFNKGSNIYLECKFDMLHVVSMVLSAAFGVWYLMKKHWLANNIFGLAFSVNGIEMISLGSVKNGCILLSLLFFYDIFWVFGTEVMVEVAKNLDAPIKVVFPMDFIENGIFGSNFAMLGLGDIVLPGVFIALLLRYDVSKGEDSKLYFYSGFMAYILGLAMTIGVLTIFNAAQPALLYLVPTCVGIPLLVGLVKGDFATLFAYDEETKEEAKVDEKKTE